MTTDTVHAVPTKKMSAVSIVATAVLIVGALAICGIGAVLFVPIETNGHLTATLYQY